MFKFKNYKLKYYDFRLLLYIIILSVIGVLVIGSATMGMDSSTMNKQIMGVSVGIFLMLMVSLIDYHWLLRYFLAIYIGTNVVLLAVLLFGTDAGTGAKRWLDVGIRIQPSEFAKVSLILCFAMLFYILEDRVSTISGLAICVAALGIPLLLIFKEPDLSTSLVVVFEFLVMIYTAKISYKWVLGALGVAIPSLIAFFYLLEHGYITFLEQYQINRILSFRDPEKYSDLIRQQSSSVMAIGSGQLYGKGLFNTSLESVKNGNFLMEQDTDFIFAVLGEELGFVGSCAVITLLCLVVVECIWIACKTKDLAGRLICVGAAALIAFQSFVNIGVATLILPNTGLPLPFISAGLSSLLSVFIIMGVVFNVGMQRKSEIF